MQTFLDWFNEGRRFQMKGPVGGAFGKPKPFQNAEIGQYTHTRDQQRNLQGPDAYNQRVAFGLTQEQKILKAAKENCGIDISPSTPSEDKFQKIDGWWKKDNTPVPVQIKYRDTGDDLLFEVIKPFTNMPILSNQNRLGRDVKPAGMPANQFDPNSRIGAQYIFHLNSSGNKLSIIETKPCYEIIYKLLKEIDAYGWSNPYRKMHSTSQGVIRWQLDGSSGVQKIMAYLPVNPVSQCPVDIKIE